MLLCFLWCNTPSACIVCVLLGIVCFGAYHSASDCKYAASAFVLLMWVIYLGILPMLSLVLWISRSLIFDLLLPCVGILSIHFLFSILLI